MRIGFGIRQTNIVLYLSPEFLRLEMWAKIEIKFQNHFHFLKKSYIMN
jgi:hypothetical protein